MATMKDIKMKKNPLKKFFLNEIDSNIVLEIVLSVLISLATAIMLSVLAYIAMRLFKYNYICGGQNLQNYVAIFSVHVSIVFISTSLMTILSERDHKVYWVDMVKSILVQPKGLNFLSLVTYAISSVAWAVIGIITHRGYVIAGSFVVGIIAITVLFARMIEVYFLKKYKEEDIKKRFIEAIRDSEYDYYGSGQEEVNKCILKLRECTILEAGKDDKAGNFDEVYRNISLLEDVIRQDRVDQKVFVPIGFFEENYYDLMIDLSMKHPTEMLEYIRNIRSTSDKELIIETDKELYRFILKGYIERNREDLFYRLMCQLINSTQNQNTGRDIFEEFLEDKKYVRVIERYLDRLFNRFDSSVVFGTDNYLKENGKYKEFLKTHGCEDINSLEYYHNDMVYFDLLIVLYGKDRDRFYDMLTNNGLGDCMVQAYYEKWHNYEQPSWAYDPEDDKMQKEFSIIRYVDALVWLTNPKNEKDFFQERFKELLVDEILNANGVYDSIGGKLIYQIIDAASQKEISDFNSIMEALINVIISSITDDGSIYDSERLLNIEFREVRNSLTKNVIDAMREYSNNLVYMIRHAHDDEKSEYNKKGDVLRQINTSIETKIAKVYMDESMAGYYPGDIINDLYSYCYTGFVVKNKQVENIVGILKKACEQYDIYGSGIGIFDAVLENLVEKSFYEEVIITLIKYVVDSVVVNNNCIYSFSQSVESQLKLREAMTESLILSLRKYANEYIYGEYNVYDDNLDRGKKYTFMANVVIKNRMESITKEEFPVINYDYYKTISVALDNN